MKLYNQYTLGPKITAIIWEALIHAMPPRLVAASSQSGAYVINSFYV